MGGQHRSYLRDSDQPNNAAAREWFLANLPAVNLYYGLRLFLRLIANVHVHRLAPIGQQFVEA